MVRGGASTPPSVVGDMVNFPKSWGQFFYEEHDQLSHAGGSWGPLFQGKLKAGSALHLQEGYCPQASEGPIQHGSHTSTTTQAAAWARMSRWLPGTAQASHISKESNSYWSGVIQCYQRFLKRISYEPVFSESALSTCF